MGHHSVRNTLNTNLFFRFPWQLCLTPNWQLLKAVERTGHGMWATLECYQTSRHFKGYGELQSHWYEKISQRLCTFVDVIRSFCFDLVSLGKRSKFNAQLVSQLVSKLVFWVESTTKDYIMAKNNVQSVFCLLCTRVIKHLHSHTHTHTLNVIRLSFRPNLYRIGLMKTHSSDKKWATLS